MKTITGYKSIAEFPPEEPIVNLLAFNNRLFVATSKRMFEIVGEKLIPLVFDMAEVDENP